MFDCLKRKFRKPEVEPERTHKEVDLWSPLAKQYPKRAKTRGKYRHKYPIGAVVHHTAGRPGTGTLDYAVKKGYCFFLIDRDGTIYQNFPLDEWGWHAGKSGWDKSKEITGSVSDELVGIEISGAGRLEPADDKKQVFKTWWGGQVNAMDVRHVSGDARPVSGYYQKFTSEQEQSLLDLLVWLKTNNRS